MSTLLVYLRGSIAFNRTIFPPRLYIYDDLIIYRKRYLIKTKEITLSYNQLAKVDLIRGILFAEINISTTGKDDIRVTYVSKGKATMAKKIIDQKIYHVHAKQKQEDNKLAQELNEFEKSVYRLKELLNKGQITKSQYNKMKNQHLKRFR